MVGGKALSIRKIAVLAMALAANLGSSGVWANKIPGVLITGHLTSVSGVEWVNIDGHQYRIASNSAAVNAVSKLTPGQLVDVQLNGPANTAASAVVNIVPHSGP
jgi:hypothetical protein